MCEIIAEQYASDLARLHSEAFETGWSEDEFQAHIRNPFDDVVGIIEDGHILGFVVVRTQADQSEILTIVVDPQHRGDGKAKSLLNAAETAVRARGADIMFLEVAADNVAAQALYHGAGYRRCGTRKGYYRRQMGRVDALLFQKRL